MDAKQDLDCIKRARRKLLRQVQWGQNLFLGVLAVSLLNQFLLGMGVSYHLLCSVAMPYYLNWIGTQVGLRWLFATVTVVLYVVGFGCWFFFRNPKWAKGTLTFYALDTVALAVMAFVFLENPMSCLLEILVHILILVAMYPCGKATTELVALKRREPRRERIS